MDVPMNTGTQMHPVCLLLRAMPQCLATVGSQRGVRWMHTDLEDSLAGDMSAVQSRGPEFRSPLDNMTALSLRLPEVTRELPR